MIDTRTCKSCSVAKPLDAFERLASRGHRGTCKACRKAAAADRKRLAAAARNACPEHQVRVARLARDREAARAVKAAAAAALRAEQEALREAQRQAQRDAARRLREEREEREAALRDDIWNAMWRGRFGRLATAALAHATATHQIKLRYGQGYISAAEMACRCAEREACVRASRACTTFEAAAAAERILERPTPPLERIKELRDLWREEPRSASIPGLIGDTITDETDPFDDGLGDWAPAWMTAERGSWSTFSAA